MPRAISLVNASVNQSILKEISVKGVPGNQRISSSVYVWKHPEHGTRECTQHDLCRTFGLDRRPINNVAKRGKPSYKGWSIKRSKG